VITAFGEVDRCVGVQDGLIVAIEPYDSRSPRTPASWSTCPTTRCCSPATIDGAALEVKRKSAEHQAFVDVGFWGGAVPGNENELRGLHGFKRFLLHSGVDEFPPLPPRTSRAS
jgi:hypothetical protein